MLSLLIVAASIVVLCNAVGMGAEPVREARDAAKLYFSNQLHALATAGAIYTPFACRELWHI